METGSKQLLRDQPSSKEINLFLYLHEEGAKAFIADDQAMSIRDVITEKWSAPAGVSELKEHYEHFVQSFIPPPNELGSVNCLVSKEYIVQDISRRIYFNPGSKFKYFLSNIILGFLSSSFEFKDKSL